MNDLKIENASEAEILSDHGTVNQSRTVSYVASVKHHLVHLLVDERPTVEKR
jgi:hypothetical protein